MSDWEHHTDLCPRYYFRLRNNADWKQPFQFNDFDPDTHTSNPHDLTGAQLRMQLRARPPISGDPVALDTSTEAGQWIIGSVAANGTALLYVPAASLNTLMEGVYDADCLIFEPSGAILSAFTAEVTIEVGVTQPVEE